jgi:uncharacterized LabA/DUF88 family protein
MSENPLRPIALFIDLESLGTPQKIAQQIRKIRWFFAKFPKALETRGFEIKEATVFAASKGKRKKEVSVERQERVTSELASFGAKMVWTKTIADTVLIEELNQRAMQHNLPQVVMLVTNDGGFVPSIVRLTRHGHFVFASGSAMSQKLRSVASHAIPLFELLS